MEQWILIEQIALWTQGNGYNIEKILDFSNHEKYDYYISSLGNLKRISKKSKKVYYLSNTTIRTDGYNANNLTDSEGNVYKITRHQIVAQHFHKEGMCEGHTVDHINRNKLDNSAQNLRWATPSEQAYNRKKKS